MYKASLFQSTLPRGSDAEAATAITQAQDFNPRSLAGATVDKLSKQSQKIEFQSTLPRGSDEIEGQVRQRIVISIHAPSRERR